MFPPLALIGNLYNRSPFLSPESVLTLGRSRRKRESATNNEKKNDTACTKAKCLQPRLKGIREVTKEKTEDRMLEKEQSLQERNSIWKEVTV